MAIQHNEELIPRRSFWIWVWFAFATTMLVLVILTQPGTMVIGLCFFAWCGGVLSTLATQEQVKKGRHNGR